MSVKWVDRKSKNTGDQKDLDPKYIIPRPVEFYAAFLLV